MSNPYAFTTLCWKCSKSYPKYDLCCPYCGVFNGNVDPNGAMAQQRAIGKRPEPMAQEYDTIRPVGDRWISVSEQLPGILSKVFVWTDKREKAIAFRGHAGWYAWPPTNDAIGEVTHWMPLPAPPTG